MCTVTIEQTLNDYGICNINPLNKLHVTGAIRSEILITQGEMQG